MNRVVVESVCATSPTARAERLLCNYCVSVNNGEWRHCLLREQNIMIDSV